MMEIPAGKYCNQGYEPNCPLTPCPFDDYRACGVPDVYKGVDIVSFRSSACLTAYPNGAVITITAKEAD
jgi:hypothetical protein